MSQAVPKDVESLNLIDGLWGTSHRWNENPFSYVFSGVIGVGGSWPNKSTDESNDPCHGMWDRWP